MNDKRGFWLAVGGAFLASSGFIVLQFLRVSQDTGETLMAWIVVATMAASIVPLMVLIAFAVATAYGWAPRAKRLEATCAWEVIVPALRSDQLVGGLSRTASRDGHRLPRGLTLTANRRGLGLWSGRSVTLLEVWISWADVMDLQLVVARDVLESFPALGIMARSLEGVVQLPVRIAGGFPFGTRTATTTALGALIQELNSLRVTSVG